MLSSSDGIAFDLYGAAKYIAETRSGWNGETEIETTYYNTSGIELGKSFSNVNKWTDFNGDEITSTNTSYEDASGNWLGNKWSESNGNQGEFYSATYDGSKTLTEAVGFDLDGDSTKSEGASVDGSVVSGTVTTYKSPSDGTTDITTGLAYNVTINTTNTLRVEKGQDTWSYTDINSATQTETRSYTNYFDKAGDHVGGVEVLDGETTLWGANWSFVGVEKDITSLGKLIRYRPQLLTSYMATRLLIQRFGRAGMACKNLRRHIMLLLVRRLVARSRVIIAGRRRTARL